jgi:exosortase/archaeosortase family protein
LLALAVGAVLVWLRDTSWQEFMLDAVPLAAGIPLVWWIGGPWRVRAEGEEFAYPLWGKIFVVVGGLIGWLMPSVTMLALTWSLAAGMVMRVDYETRMNRWGLWLMLALSFPWLVIEWPAIGWWFRMSAAWATEHFFGFMQFPVTRNGTELVVLGEVIRIEPGCAGWNLLQLTLLTGISLGMHDIRKQRKLMFFVGLMPLLAWVANFVRIVLLTALCLTYGVETANGVWHGLTGLFVLMMTLSIAKMLAGFLENRSKKSIRKIKPT